MPFLLALLLSVTLSPPFGAASARLIGFTPTTVTIEVSVATQDPTAIVLMRGEDVSGQELDPVALLERDDGTWGAVVELPARSDLLIVFELVPPRGASVLSEASSLAELGIDPELLRLSGSPEPPAEQPESGPGPAWVIVAAVAAAAALALLAVWARAGAAADRGDEEAEPPESGGETDPEDAVATT